MRAAATSSMSTLNSPFVEHLGVRVVRASDGESEVVLPLEPLHLNAWDVAHGGVTMTLLDVGLALAARSLRRRSCTIAKRLRRGSTMRRTRSSACSRAATSASSSSN
jgi:acyl-coenzyme A thioesterase PaaI-like protein